jgi:hypothetical protein
VASDSANRLPDDFYVFVTSDHPVVLWNVDRIKNISSAAAAAYSDKSFRMRYDVGDDQWFPFVPNPEYDGFLSWQALRTTTNYRAEYHAESVRCRGFRTAPSRLSAIFAWGSLEEARAAASQQGGRYRGKALKRCVLRAPPLRALRANSHIVPLARKLESSGASTPELVDMIRDTYWSGSGQRVGLNRVSSSDLTTREDVWSRDEPLWEWLLDASLEVVEDVSAAGASDGKSR